MPVAAFPAISGVTLATSTPATAQAGGYWVTVILQRVRDALGLATPRPTVLSFLSHAQRIANAATGLVYGTTTVTTEAKRQLYRLNGIPCVRLVDVKQGGRSLSKLSPRELFYHDAAWSRRIAAQRETFSQSGVDLTVIHPAEAEASPLDLTYVAITTELTDENVPLELPDDAVPIALHLSEALVLLRQRRLGEATMAMERFVALAGAHRRV